MFLKIVISLNSFAAVAHAWGDTLAHPVTGTIAQANLNTNGLALVANLVDSTFSQSLSGQTANWADVWRSTHSATAGWHFVDMMKAPPSACGYVSTDCVGRNCIIAAITDQTNLLLAHFLGDITQPLHNCNRDVGGNSDTVTFAGTSTNFHHIHDTEIPGQYATNLGYSATDYASVASHLESEYGANQATYTTSEYIDIQSLDSNGMFLAAIAMANDANSLDCNQNAFWTLYDANPSQDFSTTYYTAV
ncbi:hypothetical protein HK100_011461 [Physocladia obscura]|uniref:Uncharacterized protein n=1 Tax=Physocladia obscura TaxID=109957 RepID=A0AAD5TA87_9FUNG|nr:hypothetical protein HK100_011461 [Physocladia obscura]